MTQSTAGILFAVAAFLSWGVIPLYWRLVAFVPPLEILCHRIVWSAVFTLALMLAQGRARDILAALRDRAQLRTLTGTALLIGGNWLIFIHAVTAGHVLEASLGYYINPLFSVALGRLVLGEMLRLPQRIALGLAATGVVALAVSHGGMPWIALALAATFAVYGLLRKTARADSLLGLCVEALLLAPFALAYLIWLQLDGRATLFHHSTGTDLVLMGAGVITALPLLWFAHAARRLDLSTVGILQYLSPSCQFLLAVFVFDETFTGAHLASFALIWAALALYTTDAVRRLRGSPLR